MTELPRILLVSSRPAWPPYPGFKQRARTLFETLAALARVDAVLLQPEPGPPDVPPETKFDSIRTVPIERRSGPKAMAKMATEQLPWSCVKLGMSTAAPAVRAMATQRRYDALWAIDLSAWSALPTDLPLPIVVDFDDLQDAKIRHRMKAQSKSPRSAREAFFRTIDRIDLPRWERLQDEALARAAAVTVCSEQDRATLARSTVEVLPNCYDLPDRPAGADRGPVEPVLLLVGAMTYRPNVEAAFFLARDVMPLVRRVVPDARARIVGQEGPDVGQLVGLPGVEIVGPVHDMTAELRGAAVSVAPLLSGGGTRIKLLEAFAHQVPVVATTIGAEGLAVRSGEHLVLADTAEAFAEACIRLLQHPDVGASMTTNAFELVRSKYGTDVAKAAVTTILDRVAG